MRNNVTDADNQQERLANTLHSLRESSETIRRIPQIPKELILLLGLLFTDGCVSPRPPHSWKICFYSTSDSLVDLFQNCMVKLFLIKKSKVCIGPRREDGGRTAVVNSKEIGNYLVNTFGTFRTLKFADGKLPSAKLPISFLKTSGYIKEFLQVAYSCDGGVSLYPAYRSGSQGGTKWLIRTVFLACAHPKLRSDYLQLLKYLEIKVREVPQDGKIKIENEENIRKFAKEIGFLPGVFIGRNSKLWYRHEKRIILTRLLESYGRPFEVMR